ncbi:MAG: beta-propeller fold lactonase family protein [Haliscomenobacter sp.]|nr:beta-propeller fold lactonase family protein [Haliscomenobacter sp.]
MRKTHADRSLPPPGKFPRNFAIAPGGEWALVANQHTGNLTTFRINAGGELDFRWELAAPVTVCIQFAGKQEYPAVIGTPQGPGRE